MDKRLHDALQKAFGYLIKTRPIVIGDSLLDEANKVLNMSKRDVRRQEWGGVVVAMAMAMGMAVAMVMLMLIELVIRHKPGSEARDS